MFVTKLLRTKKGNCHSLPYLFKILAESLGAEAYLALAPNHIYIKHKDSQGNWLNVELTNASFPRDVWIMSNCGVTMEAIKNEVYMDPLTDEESVALAFFDLALAYERQFGLDDYVLRCCATLTEYYPRCIMAYVIKSGVLLKYREDLLRASGNARTPEVLALEQQMNALYRQIDDFGYKQESKIDYEKWQKDVEIEKQKQAHAKQ